MVEVSTHNNVFIGANTRYHARYISHSQGVVLFLADRSDRVGLYKKSWISVQAYPCASLKMLQIVVVEQRLYAPLAHLCNDVLLRYACATLSGLSSFEQVVGKKVNMSACCILADACQGSVEHSISLLPFGFGGMCWQ